MLSIFKKIISHSTLVRPNLNSNQLGFRQVSNTNLFEFNVASNNNNASFENTDGDELKQESERVNEENDLNSEKRRNKLNVVKSTSNGSILGQYMLKVKSRKMRNKSGLILMEGKRLISDAASVGVIPESIFFSRERDLKEIDLPYEQVQLFKTPYKELQLWSDLTTSPGILAICKKPSLSHESKVNEDITVICDQVREPGNLGGIIRSIAAAGASRLIVSKGCTDPWDPKVLRGSAGAHFRISIHQEETWNMEKFFDNNISVFLADNNICNNFPSHSSCVIDTPPVPYHSIDYREQAHTVIVIGGETEGLSSDAFQFASKFQGTRIFIPLSNRVESLNNAAALSVILFEIKRQRLVS